MNPFKKIYVVAFVAALMSGCKEQTKHDGVLDTTAAVGVTHEAYRPQLHFSPREKWMNDPNGMFYFDGEYHLFYQYYPEGTKWGPMHWGHAVSKNLIHWQHLPIALYPDSTGYIFSGSAVVDSSNTSGLAGTGETAIVALYTIHDPKKEKAGKIDYQTQGLAYSVDKGRTWKKYHSNPILRNPGIIDFRDPKVTWHKKSKQWVMALAVKDHISFYGSSDLKRWTKLSDFGANDGDHGGVWECPDLVTLKDDHGVEKSVLIVSINPGGPNGGSATQYFVGDFDGKIFKSDTPGKNAGWVDYGPDNYAGVTYSNIPEKDGRCITIGWMSNWKYGQEVPTVSWRSAMTLPRVLTLKNTGKGHVLLSYPVKELDQIVSMSGTIASTQSDTIDIGKQSKVDVKLSRIRGKVKKGDFVFELSNDKNQKVLIGLDVKRNAFFVDRSASGDVSFHSEFGAPIVAPRVMNDAWIRFTLIVDVSSVEVFFDNGASVLTVISFPDEGYSDLKLYGKNGAVSADSIEVDVLKSIW